MSIWNSILPSLWRRTGEVDYTVLWADTFLYSRKGKRKVYIFICHLNSIFHWSTYAVFHHSLKKTKNSASHILLLSMTHFLMSVSNSYLGHLHCVGQHLLQSADRQWLLQNKGAYGQVRGHILQTHIYSTGVKIAREKDNFINHQRGKK